MSPSNLFKISYFWSWFLLRHDELEKCSSTYIEWFLCGLICSNWMNVKIGRFLGQNHLCCRYFVSIFLFSISALLLIIFLFLCDFSLPIGLWIMFSIFLVLFGIVDVIMNFILRIKYVEHSKIDESVFQSFLLMTFCRPCAYGEIGNYIKINNENNNEP